MGEKHRLHSPLDPQLLEMARRLRQRHTDAERLLWILLRNRRLGGFKFRRQYPIEPYVLDFYCEQAKLAVEIDGGQHHTQRERERDEGRTAFLAKEGIAVVRYWNHEVLRETDAVLEAIYNSAFTRISRTGADRPNQKTALTPTLSGSTELAEVRGEREKGALVEARCIVAPPQTGRVDRVVQALTRRSRAEARGLFDHGCVTVNGAACVDPGVPVAVGDSVVVRHNPRMRYREQPRERTNAAFQIVFEDDDLIVVDKSAAILTVPTDRGETNSLLDALGKYLNRRGHRGRVTVVQRLDRGTSGLLVFGKNPRIGRELASQFRVRKAEREYIALVAGTPARDTGTFTSRLATAKSLRRYSVRQQPDGPKQEGEEAVTHFRVERRLRGATLVRVRLETGRRNQIRVHFAEAGHPILGDERYRAELARHPAWRAKRLALHAIVLGFDHPRTHGHLRFESPLPAEFARFLSAQAVN